MRRLPFLAGAGMVAFLAAVLALSAVGRSGEDRPPSTDAVVLRAGNDLARARVTADPALQERAEAALQRVLRDKPGDGGALTEMAVLRTAQHDFAAGLRYARRAVAAAPDAVKPLGVLVDALVETGRYGEARVALQRMVDRKPNLDSYARVSYLRELAGNLGGAERALRYAASAGGANAENTAYVQALLGDLLLQRGRLGAAARAYTAADASVPAFPAALLGRARIAQARGHEDLALRLARRVDAKSALPGPTVAHGQALLAAGHPAGSRLLKKGLAAQRALEGERAEQDAEVAILEAEFGRPERAVGIARRAWRAAPSIRSADALGWTLSAAGRHREATSWAARALALGTVEPKLLARAAIVAERAGRDDLARRWRARISPAARRALPHTLRTALRAGSA